METLENWKKPHNFQN